MRADGSHDPDPLRRPELHHGVGLAVGALVQVMYPTAPGTLSYSLAIVSAAIVYRLDKWLSWRFGRRRRKLPDKPSDHPRLPPKDP
jgi:hypothetical protein